MELKLNPAREAYKEFCGRNAEQMPKLIADSRVPMNVAQLMQRRLDVRNSDADVKKYYLDNYFDTGDAILDNPNGKIKIVLNSQTLRDMNSESKLRDRVLILTEDIYNNLQGEEFNKRQFGKINRYLSKKDVKSHQVWRILARDQALLNDYADYIFAEGKRRFGYDNMMGVYFDSVRRNKNHLELITLSILGLELGSDAECKPRYDLPVSRFLGIDSNVW